MLPDLAETAINVVDGDTNQPIALLILINFLQCQNSSKEINRGIGISRKTLGKDPLREIVTGIITEIMNVIVTEVLNVTEKKTEIDTIGVLLHTHETEVGALIAKIQKKEVTMNLKANLIVQSIITAWLMQLYFTNNKKSLLLKTLFEHLQSESYLRDKKKKAEDKSSQGKYS